MKILYLEDNPQDAVLVQRYINTTEHVLEVVHTIEDAEQSSDDSIDLFLLDILINDNRSGFDFVKRLRKQGYYKPFVAVTALSSDKDVKNCRTAGFNAVLVKPYTIMNLANIIDEAQNGAL